MAGGGKLPAIFYTNSAREARLLTTISFAIAVLSIAVLLIAAYRDGTTFTIPNSLCVAVVALAATRMIVALDLDAALYTIAVAIIVFLIGLLLFGRGFVGGGDVKLLTATVLLVGYGNVFSLLVCTSMSGAIIALIVFGGHKLAPNSVQPLVPYGVAIALAGITILLHPNFNLLG